jgi:two-component system nitrate/nitrite response regulator NarL
VEPLRILVVSSDPLARSGLAALLSGRPEVIVSAQVAPGAEVGAALAAHIADAAVWDLGSEGSAEMLQEVAGGGLPVVAVLASAEQAHEAIAAGARGLILRDAAPERLVAALLAASSGLWAVDDGLASAVMRPRTAPAAEPLTPRELEVLALLSEGLSNKGIAQRLGISEHTAKFHVNAILGKLGAESRSEAIVKAARMGLVVL